MHLPYMPSNGTEAVWFEEKFCETCYRNRNRCMILMRALALYPSDKKYPAEWCYDENNRPTCATWKDRKTYVAERRAKANKNQIPLFED